MYLNFIQNSYYRTISQKKLCKEVTRTPETLIFLLVKKILNNISHHSVKILKKKKGTV